MTPEHEKIADALFGALSEGESLYAILDSARNIDIAFQLQNIPGVEYVSLYKGLKEEPMWDAAPYLVRCARDSELFCWTIEEGWANSWGIFLTSKAGLDGLCNHFQEFLRVKLDDHQEVFFRFYDPRVLRVFLPTCTAQEHKQFFGPISAYLMEEDQLQAILKFTASSNMTTRNIVQLSTERQSGGEL